MRCEALTVDVQRISRPWPSLRARRRPPAPGTQRSGAELATRRTAVRDGDAGTLSSVTADYFVSFSLNLSDDDREALDRPDFKLYEQARAAQAPVGPPRPPTAVPHHLIRVSARAPDDARRALVSTLGREPDELEVLYTVEP